MATRLQIKSRDMLRLVCSYVRSQQPQPLRQAGPRFVSALNRMLSLDD